MLQRFLQKTGKKNGFVFPFPFLLFGCGGGQLPNTPIEPGLMDEDSSDDLPTGEDTSSDDILLSNDEPELGTNNNPPHSIFLKSYFSIEDNDLGHVQFSDENPDEVDISISGPDASKFYIEQDTLVKIDPLVSSDDQTEYTILITVVDDVGQKSEKQINISKLSDVSDKPLLELRLINSENGEIHLGIFIDQDLDPDELGIESIGIRVDFEASDLNYVSSSFVTMDFSYGVLYDLDANNGKLSFAAVSATGPSQYDDGLLAQFTLTKVDDFSSSVVSLYDVNVDGVQFGVTDLLITDQLIA